MRLSNNRKVLIKNTFFLSLLQVMRYLIPILVLPYITRIIGVVHFGEIAVSVSACLIIQIFVDYGFNYIGVREVATHKDNIPYISYLYSSITCARCFIFLVCSVVMMLLTLYIPFLAEIRLLIFIALFPVLFSIFMPEWIYQGLEEMEFITYIHVVSRVIYVILIFVFIKQEDDYLLYPIFNIVGLSFASMASLVILRSKCIYLHLVHFNVIIKYLKEAKDLFINEICSSLLANLYSLFIGHFLSFRDAGIYSSCSKLIVAANHGQGIINRVFFPFLAQHGNKFRRYFYVNMGLSFFVSIIGFLLTPIVYPIFYPEEFNDGILVMKILCLGLFFVGISGSLSSNYLIIRKKEVIVRNISAFILFYGVVVFFLMVYFWGLLGAALGALSVNITRCALLVIFSFKYRRTRILHNK